MTVSCEINKICNCDCEIIKEKYIYVNRNSNVLLMVHKSSKITYLVQMSNISSTRLTIVDFANKTSPTLSKFNPT